MASSPTLTLQGAVGQFEVDVCKDLLGIVITLIEYSQL